MSRSRKSYGRGNQKVVAPVHNRTRGWCKWCHPHQLDHIDALYNYGCLSHSIRTKGGKGGSNGNFHRNRDIQSKYINLHYDD